MISVCALSDESKLKSQTASWRFALKAPSPSPTRLALAKYWSTKGKEGFA